MKKLISVIFALLLSFSLFACGNDSSSNDGATTPEVDSTPTLTPMVESPTVTLDEDYFLFVSEDLDSYASALELRLESYDLKLIFEEDISPNEHCSGRKYNLTHTGSDVGDLLIWYADGSGGVPRVAISYETGEDPNAAAFKHFGVMQRVLKETIPELANDEISNILNLSFDDNGFSFETTEINGIIYEYNMSIFSDGEVRSVLIIKNQKWMSEVLGQ